MRLKLVKDEEETEESEDQGRDLDVPREELGGDLSVPLDARRVRLVRELDGCGFARVFDVHVPLARILLPGPRARRLTAPDNGIYSIRMPHFEVGGSKWILWLRRPPVFDDQSKLGAFLVCETAEDMSRRQVEHYRAFAAFQIAVLNAAVKSTEHGHLFSAAKGNRVQGNHDWGWENFTSIGEVKEWTTADAPVHGAPWLDSPEGESSSVIFRVTVRVQHAEIKGREPAGVGLYNQGATCYLNSLLQTLFHLSTFREATFRLPVSYFRQSKRKTGSPTARQLDLDSEFRETLPFALAKLFWAMQTSSVPVKTNFLTRSFGWCSADTLEQQDVQELLRKLIDNLEEKMKGTSLEGFMDRLFLGRSRNYVKCLNVDFQSERVETFHDIQVNVQGMGTLEAALEDQLAKEELIGENQYQASDEATGVNHGLQDAHKGMEWLSFPPVLILHLRRFTYDWAQDLPVKIDDRLEFPEELDMGRFLRTESRRTDPVPAARPPDLLPPMTPAPPTPSQGPADMPPLSLDDTMDLDTPATQAAGALSRSPSAAACTPAPQTPRTDAAESRQGPPQERAEGTVEQQHDTWYKLHSVLVHSGTVAVGHYYVYIRSASGEWYKYDDSRVFRASMEEAVLETTGGENPARPWVTADTSAYMLVYVSASQWAHMRREGRDIPIPRALREVLQQQQEAGQKRKAEAEIERPLPRPGRNVEIWTEVELKHISASGTCTADLVPADSMLELALRDLQGWPQETPDVRRQRFLGAICDHLNGRGQEQRWAPEAARVFIFRPRENGTERPWGPLSPGQCADIAGSIAPSRHQALRLFVDQRQSSAPDDHLIFFKVLQRASGVRFSVLGCLSISADRPSQEELCRRINSELLQRDAGAPLELWEERRIDCVHRILPETPVDDALSDFGINDLCTGDVVIVDPEPGGDGTTVLEEWHRVNAGWDARVVDFFEADADATPLTMRLVLTDTFPTLLRNVAALVGHPEDKLRLSLMYEPEQRCEELGLPTNEHKPIMSFLHAESLPPDVCLVYEKLSMPLAEVRTLLEVKANWVVRAGKHTKLLRFTLPKQATVGDFKLGVLRQLHRGERGEVPGLGDPGDEGLQRDKGRMLVSSVENYCITGILADEQPLPSGGPFRCEWAPEAHPAAPLGGGTPDSVLVPVAHFERLYGDRQAQCHSEPYWMLCAPGETRKAFLGRLAGLMGVKVEKVCSWKLYALEARPFYRQKAVFTRTLVEEDSDVYTVLKDLWRDSGTGPEHLQIFLGIEHRNRVSDSSRGIHIKG